MGGQRRLFHAAPLEHGPAPALHEHDGAITRLRRDTQDKVVADGGAVSNEAGVQANTGLQSRALDLTVQQIALGVAEQRMCSDCRHEGYCSTASQG